MCGLPNALAKFASAMCGMFSVTDMRRMSSVFSYLVSSTYALNKYPTEVLTMRITFLCSHQQQ